VIAIRKRTRMSEDNRKRINELMNDIPLVKSEREQIRKKIELIEELEKALALMHDGSLR
jgi:hypothetical protein